ncbi:MAG: thermonuclease family protein [Chloroflexi bacterium]|nr:thermonuclease family protein [Chloroflexota bacterium]
MKLPRIVRVLLAMLCLSACLLGGCANSVPAGESGRVVDVVDGDTIWVNMSGEEFKVRYIGINAPELAHDEVEEQPYARAAEEANRRLVEGQIVTLVKDVSETDRYGRLLRYVYVGDTLINAELVRQGMAHAKAYPPDTGLQEELDAAQDEARAARRGIWATD